MRIPSTIPAGMPGSGAGASQPGLVTPGRPRASGWARDLRIAACNARPGLRSSPGWSRSSGASGGLARSPPSRRRNPLVLHAARPWLTHGALEPRFYAACWPGSAWTRPRFRRRTTRRGGRCCASDSPKPSPSTPGTTGPRCSGHADACVTPVLTFAAAAQHPHLAARGTLIEVDGVVQAAPAPRFSYTRPGGTPVPARVAFVNEAEPWR